VNIEKSKAPEEASSGAHEIIEYDRIYETWGYLSPSLLLLSSTEPNTLEKFSFNQRNQSQLLFTTEVKGEAARKRN